MNVDVLVENDIMNPLKVFNLKRFVDVVLSSNIFANDADCQSIVFVIPHKIKYVNKTEIVQSYGVKVIWDFLFYVTAASPFECYIMPLSG